MRQPQSRSRGQHRGTCRGNGAKTTNGEGSGDGKDHGTEHPADDPALCERRRPLASSLRVPQREKGLERGRGRGTLPPGQPTPACGLSAQIYSFKSAFVTAVARARNLGLLRPGRREEGQLRGSGLQGVSLCSAGNAGDHAPPSGQSCRPLTWQSQTAESAPAQAGGGGQGREGTHGTCAAPPDWARPGLTAAQGRGAE